MPNPIHPFMIYLVLCLTKKIFSSSSSHPLAIVAFFRRGRERVCLFFCAFIFLFFSFLLFLLLIVFIFSSFVSRTSPTAP